MTEEFVPQHPGEKVVSEIDVILTPDGRIEPVDKAWQSMQTLSNIRHDQEYARKVAGEILSEYYGDHDAK